MKLDKLRVEHAVKDQKAVFILKMISLMDQKKSSQIFSQDLACHLVLNYINDEKQFM